MVSESQDFWQEEESGLQDLQDFQDLLIRIFITLM